MLTPLLSRFFLLVLTISALGCSQKKGDEPAPTPDITGHWDQRIVTQDIYNPDGSLMETKTVQFPGDGKGYSIVFKADKRFENRFGDESRFGNLVVYATGSYMYTSKSLVLNFTPSTTVTTPVFNYSITKLTATELVLVLDQREPGNYGAISTNTYIKR